MIKTTHALVRELRAAARNIQAGEPVDIQAVRGLIELWVIFTPVAAGRVLTMVEGAENELMREQRAAALGHLRGAIEIVERVQSQQRGG